MTKPLSEYYKDGEKAFLQELVNEMDASSAGWIKGQVLRGNGVAYAILKGQLGFQCEFLVMINTQNNGVNVMLRGEAEYQGKMDISFKSDMKRLTPYAVVEAILNKVGLGLQMSQERSEAHTTNGASPNDITQKLSTTLTQRWIYEKT